MNIGIGDIIICINNNIESAKFTINKKYTIISKNRFWFYIKDDNGKLISYNTSNSNFTIIKDIRYKKIIKLKNIMFKNKNE